MGPATVRNVIEYRLSGTAEMLCFHSVRDEPDIM
jgi:hypothetical protein